MNILFQKTNELKNIKKNGAHRKMTIPHSKYGHLPNTYFRYLTCLLDRGHIIILPAFCLWFKFFTYSFKFGLCY